ncbi:hypothetical protein EHS25_009574 [Saitozyma podzolica]|uniref:Myb-like domain-containing protein n=1 Tax=Saitozyma podzolica TaxID=1890683 RepID=A0A427YJK1_9TREE|nr:hypothetical protein EHS25_009574 [Saitozyma podzolica]
MPRATLSTSKPHEAKPYLKTEPGVTVDEEPRSKNKDKGESAGSGKYEYNKLVLVSLVVAPAKPDWLAIATTLHPTQAQCYDLWRKVLLPNLLANKPWANSSKDWSTDEKVELLLQVIQRTKPEWEAISQHFPGRTKSQVCDVWRKVVLPRLKKGQTIE